MKPVNQEYTWDCHIACVASLLEIPLEDMPEIHPSQPTELWHAKWKEWFLSKGLCYYDIGFVDAMQKVHGYTIGLVPSQRFEGCYHSIICLDGEPHFDPQRTNQPYDVEDIEAHTLIVPLDPKNGVIAYNG